MGLGILTPPTCVGLRYGHTARYAQRGFSWRLGSAALSAIAFVPRLGRGGEWICLLPGLDAFNSIHQESRLPWRVPPEHAPVVPES
jgi:hypothetical protein